MRRAEPFVIYEVADRIATVRLNRPEVRNALNRALLQELWDAVVRAGSDGDVDAVILTGADPAFCAGIDLNELSDEVPPSASNRPSGEGPERASNGLFRYLPEIDKPIIGAVNGTAATGGLEVALQCTFLVASDRAHFVDTHARVGVMPGGGATVLLAQSIGLRRAIEMSLTGDFLDAAEALELGLVNHVVPHDDLLPFTRHLVGTIVGNDQNGVRRLLGHYRQIANAATLDEALLIEGYMSATWRIDASRFGSRRDQVVARGSKQSNRT